MNVDAHIDREVGQDTEHFRNTFLKYVAMGQQTGETEVARAQAQAKDQAKQIFAELDQLLTKTDHALAGVDQYEKQKIGELKYCFGDAGQNVSAELLALRDEVTAKREDIKVKVLDHGLVAIRSKYLPPEAAVEE
jgi:hypothetical protein